MWTYSTIIFSMSWNWTSRIHLNCCEMQTTYPVQKLLMSQPEFWRIWSMKTMFLVPWSSANFTICLSWKVGVGKMQSTILKKSAKGQNSSVCLVRTWISFWDQTNSMWGRLMPAMLLIDGSSMIPKQDWANFHSFLSFWDMGSFGMTFANWIKIPCR